MKGKDSKLEKKNANISSRTVPITMMFIILCGLSFYLGGIYYSDKKKFSSWNVVSPKQEASSKVPIVPFRIKAVTFPECGKEYQDYTPCTDPKVVHDTIYLKFMTKH